MKVYSTSIEEIDYDEDKKILSVTFWSGATYKYFDVDYFDYEELIDAESIGRFFNQTIKKKYSCEKVEEQVPEPSAF